MTAIPAQSIEQFMQRDFQVISETATAGGAADQMTEQRIGCLVVQEDATSTENQQILGLVSETDLVRKVMAADPFDPDVQVRECMEKTLHTIPINRSMLDASHFMEKHGVRHLCVSDGNEIVGLISIRDLVRFFVYAESGPIRELDNVYRPLSVLMQTKIETIGTDDTTQQAAQRMEQKHIGALLVQQEGEMQGIITERDLIQKILPKEKDPADVQVGKVMNKPLIDIDINRTVLDASDLMAEKWIRHLPVTDNGVIVGILSVRDLIRMIAVRDRPRFLRQK